MKKIASLLLIAAIAFSFVACKKSKEDREELKGIVGYWELAQVSGSMPVKEYAPGNGNILEIKANDTYSGSYTYYNADTVVKTGPYHIVADNSVRESVCLNIEEGKYTHRFIKTLESVAVKNFFEVSENELSFVSGCYAVDGGVTTTYRRVDGRGTGGIKN